MVPKRFLYFGFFIAPSAARNVRVLPWNDPAVGEVLWDEPLNPNGRVGYRLRYYGNSSLLCSAASERIVDVVENRRWLITDFKPFENYTVVVISYNLLHNISCCQSDTNAATTFETPSSRELSIFFGVALLTSCVHVPYHACLRTAQVRK